MYTIQEVADLMKVHRNTVSRWIKNKQLEVVRIGGTARIPKESLHKINSKEQKDG